MQRAMALLTTTALMTVPYIRSLQMQSKRYCLAKQTRKLHSTTLQIKLITSCRRDHRIASLFIFKRGNAGGIFSPALPLLKMKSLTGSYCTEISHSYY